MYALRNIWRSRRWSSFAIFSVAAGVATVVALHSLGLAIADSLVDNVRISLKGDIQLRIGSQSLGAAFIGSSEIPSFTDGQIDRIQSLANEHGWELDLYSATISSQVAPITDSGSIVGRLRFITTYYVNPQTHPLTYDIIAIEPAGIPFNELIVSSTDVVISQNFADNEGVDVGDLLRVSGNEEPFVIRGIVPTEVGASFDQLFAAFFGFVYFDQSVLQNQDVLEGGINQIGVLLPDGSTPEEIEDAESLIRNVVRDSPFWIRIETVPERLQRNERIGDILQRFIVVMGLGAMLIGGVGIINTMLVMVRRRTNEIAALKTFGLKARQVALLFISEAMILGVIGSLLGSVLGIILSGFINQFGATLIQQSLSWRIYPSSLLFGMVVGVVISSVFGVLPVFNATQVRPSIVLRPNEVYIPRVGCVQSLFALLIIVITIGVIAGQILANIWVGLIGVALTLLLLGILILLLWVVVWLVGKLPSFGIVDLQLVLSNMTTRRWRTATTLLALSAGMFALSSISFFSTSVRDVLQFTFSDTLGGNVLVLPVLPQSIAEPIIETRLNSLDGIKYRTKLLFYSGFAQGNTNSKGVSIVVRESDNPNLRMSDMQAGRSLLPSDAGQLVAVYQPHPDFVDSDIEFEVGERVRLQVYGSQQDVYVEIIGIAQPIDPTDLQTVSVSGDFTVPTGVINASANFQLNIVQTEDEQLNEVLLGISSLPLVFAIDISFINGVIGRLITQFSAIPVLVGLLSLGAAAVIMANTVALSTLERRRQIGILKSVGLRSNRVLRIMLIENIFISLLGGVFGIGLSALGVWIMTELSLPEAQLIPVGAIPVAIGLILVAVFIGAVATFLSASVAVRERVLNVLRYD